MKEPLEPPSRGGREETPFPFAGSRFSSATGLSQGCPGEGTRPRLTSCPSSQVHGRARRTRDPAPCMLRRARRLGRAPAAARTQALGLRVGPRGPRPRPRPRGGSSAAPHRASRPGVRLSRAPLPGHSRLHSVLSSSHLPAGRGPPARPRARVAFLPSFHRSRLARGSGLLLPSACPASPESRAVHWVTALRIHLSSVILWKMDTLLSRPQQHSLRDEGEQSVLPGTRRRDRGPLRDAAPDSPARTQGFVQTSRRGGCAAVAFPRVGPVGVTFPPSRCRYYDPLENRTKTRDVECRPGQEIS